MTADRLVVCRGLHGWLVFLLGTGDPRHDHNRLLLGLFSSEASARAFVERQRASSGCGRIDTGIFL